MAVKIILLAAVVALGQAAPFYFSAVPGAFIPRASRSPSIAYGFGSGFASNIGGIKHSNSIGASFQTGDGQAYGAGIGSSDGNVFANGVGYAHTNPSVYRSPAYSYTPYATPYYSPYQYSNPGYNLRDSYGNAVATAQNFGNTGTSIVQSQNTPYGSTASAVNFNPYQSRHSFRNPGYGGTVSYAATTGFGATAASTTNGFGGTAKSIAQNSNGGDYNTAISASETGPDGVGASTAQTVQQSGGTVKHSGATSINGPGIQASHSHSINTGNGVGTYY